MTVTLALYLAGVIIWYYNLPASIGKEKFRETRRKWVTHGYSMWTYHLVNQSILITMSVIWPIIVIYFIYHWFKEKV